MKYKYGQQVNTETLPKDNILEGLNCSAIGIQAPPGKAFKLYSNGEGITIGRSGIYELDLNDETFITYLVFQDNLTLNEQERVIVDYKYLEANEGGNS